MKRFFLLVGLFCGSVLAQSANPQALYNAGRWAEAASAAAKVGDYALAATAVNRDLECPSPDQPKGQAWDGDRAAKGVAYAQQQLASAKTNEERANALFNYGNLVGIQSITVINISEVLRMARENKKSYEQAIALAPNDMLYAATYAVWQSKAANRGGLVLGVTRNTARSAVNRAIALFNATPDGDSTGQAEKAYAATRIGMGLEGLNDPNLKKFFEVAIKLGDGAGTPFGRCAANLARVHLGRDITNF